MKLQKTEGGKCMKHLEHGRGENVQYNCKSTHAIKSSYEEGFEEGKEK